VRLGMTTVLVDAEAQSQAADVRPRWQSIAIGAIVLLALVLYAWGIGSTDLRNTFFAVAVRSMSKSFTGFVFGSFDMANMMTIDKPPMAFWPQVVSVWIFGFHGWALVLPQVLEGTAAVFLLHRTVRRWAGENVALLAALILALTPITVVINRTNNTDTLLMLWCVAAAYATVRAVEPGATPRSTRLWLMQAALWVGCGFTTKMLAGWLVVPPIVLAYLIGRKLPWARRVVDLACAACVLAVASLWWVALTTLWPGKKPYEAGSSDGTTWNLIFVHNGLDRIFGVHAAAASHPAAQGGSSGGGASLSPAASNVVTIGKAIGMAFNGGTLGLSRIFGRVVGGQIAWLLPLTLLLLITAAVGGIRATRQGPPDRFRAGVWVMWGSWIVVMGLLFSYQQGTYHAYYTTQMAPAIAAVVAGGLAMLWRYRHQSGWLWLVLPVGMALTTVWTWVLVSRDTGYYGWLRYAVVILAVAAVAALLVERFTTRATPRAAVPAVASGLAALLLAPAVWSVASAVHPAKGFADGAIPTAGPEGWSFGAGAAVPGPLQNFLHTGQLPGGSYFSSEKLSPEQQKLLQYVTANAGGARIPLAVEGGGLRAEDYAAHTNLTVIAMGGFDGVDDTPSVSQLTDLNRNHELAFVLSQPPKAGFGGFGNTPTALKRMTWVQQNCAEVPSSAYGVPATHPTQVSTLASLVGFGEQILYRC
jgi:4-amino-4-deoxy-L-arabinose transferase-like glycosyltransferase